MTVETFGIEKEFLHSILNEIRDGKTQLPEFQRDWRWPDQNVISLLASVSLAYPVGAIMLLRANTDGDVQRADGSRPVRFKQRPVEGSKPSPDIKAERLILDGQQRLTSLFQSLMKQEPVKTQDVRKKPLEGWLYVDMQKALSEDVDREEAIRMLPVDRVVKNFRNEILEDYSTSEREFAAMLFPLNRVFDYDDWHMGYQEHWNYEREKLQMWNAFRQKVVERFTKYQLPVIELGKETDRQAVCQVFEKVNTGGVTLNVFELLTATYAADEFDLRKDWRERKAEISGPDFKVLKEVADTDFLQAVTLLATRENREQALAQGGDAERAPRIGCRRIDMLALRLDQYQRWAPNIVKGLRHAAKFLHTQRFYDTKFLPYGSQLVPLSAIFAVLGNEADNQGAREKIARWFWCGVMGELYGGASETRFARDLPEVVEWVRGTGPEPRTIMDAIFSPSRLLTLRTRLSAAYKGIYTLLLRDGALDWRTGDEATIASYYDEAIDIHHIFPKDWCEKSKIPAQRYDSIINKTPLSARTNRIIGGRAPSDYLTRLANSAQISADQLDANVATHVAQPDLLRGDSFDKFFDYRAKAIVERIERAMGKPAGPAAQDPIEEPALTYAEVDEDDE